MNLHRFAPLACLLGLSLSGCSDSTPSAQVEPPLAGCQGVDYLGTARVLAATARHLQHDLVVCGDRSQDELQGAMGPAVDTV